MGTAKKYISIEEEFNRWQNSGRAESMQKEHIIAVEGALKEMQFCPGMNTLDIGCGNGYATRLMAKQILPGGRAFGVDIAENMVESARIKSQQVHNTFFEVGNFLKLPFDADFFDIILSVESIYYADDILDALKEIRRVLKPCGKFYCITYFYKEHANSAVWSDLIPVIMHYLSEEEYIKAFKEVGFTNVYTRRIYDHRPTDEKTFKPGWGYNNIDELIHFKHNIGALLITGSYE